MRHTLSLRWLATRAIVVAILVWVPTLVLIDQADAAPYDRCRHEDSRFCVYDERHVGPVALRYAPRNFWVGRAGKVWRLPHHIAHRLLYGERREYVLCPTDGEDHGPCVWAADTRFNLRGTSYFLSATGGVWPLPHHIAHFLVVER